VSADENLRVGLSEIRSSESIRRQKKDVLVRNRLKTSLPFPKICLAKHYDFVIIAKLINENAI